MSNYSARWIIYKSKNTSENKYSKWHYVQGGGVTLCGIHVPIGNHGILPETQDGPYKVNCKKCNKTLDNGSYSK